MWPTPKWSSRSLHVSLIPFPRHMRTFREYPPPRRANMECQRLWPGVYEAYSCFDVLTVRICKKAQQRRQPTSTGMIGKTGPKISWSTIGPVSPCAFSLSTTILKPIVRLDLSCSPLTTSLPSFAAFSTIAACRSKAASLTSAQEEREPIIECGWGEFGYDSLSLLISLWWNLERSQSTFACRRRPSRQLGF